MEKTIEGIRLICDEVAETWLANDGSLTWAAELLLSFGSLVIADIESRDFKRIEELDVWEVTSSADHEIIYLAQEWARKEES